MNTGKSIWSVLAGILVNVVLSLITDTVLEKTGIFTPPSEGFFTTWMICLALAYRLVYTYLGGYVTARLAPANPMKHVTILGTIGTVLCVVGIFVAWDLSQHWYPIALAVTAFPVTWLGGKRASSQPG
ncbi:MAG: hypothetical protein JNK10_03835 [Cyclobacteriaceae bacterium]|nr:hypothetical protein [Cyclobacteriaceae bacterium]